MRSHVRLATIAHAQRAAAYGEKSKQNMALATAMA